MPARHCVQTVELWSICLHSRHFIYRVPKLVTFLFFPIHGTFVYVSFFYFLFVYLFYILVVASFLFLPSQSLSPTTPHPTPPHNPLLFCLQPGKGRSPTNISKTWLATFLTNECEVSEKASCPRQMSMKGLRGAPEALWPPVHGGCYSI